MQSNSLLNSPSETKRAVTAHISGLFVSLGHSFAGKAVVLSRALALLKGVAERLDTHRGE